MTRVPVQDLLDLMELQPEGVELRAAEMIRMELIGAADLFLEPPDGRSRRWRAIALYATLMADHAAYLAREAQLTPPPSA